MADQRSPDETVDELGVDSPPPPAQRVRQISSADLSQFLGSNEVETASVIELTEDPAPRSVPDGPRYPTLPSFEDDVRIPAQPALHVDVLDLGPTSRRPIARLSDITELEPSHGGEDELVPTSVRALLEVREVLGQREREVASLAEELQRRERELEAVRSRRSPRSRRRREAAESEAPSSLGQERVGFLSDCLEQAFAHGWRTAEEFAEELEPAYVMRELERHPAVRAMYLTQLIGLPERTALRTPASDAGRLVQAALEEHECPPGEFVRLFRKTATHGYVEPARIWRFAAGPSLGDAARDKKHARHDGARRVVAGLVARALGHGLLSPAQIVDGLSVDKLAESLPRAALGGILRAALESGRRGGHYADADVMQALPPELLVQHLSPALVIERLLDPTAAAWGFADVGQ